jgi:hypothetical protein
MEENASIQLNTNIKDYNIDELFQLLNIDIEMDTEYEDVKRNINKAVDKNVKIFESIGNNHIVQFFEQVREVLLGSRVESTENMTENQRLLLTSNSVYDAETNRGVKSNSTDTTSKELFNAAGAGNPINRKTITKLLNIDSRFRKNYGFTTPTNYKLDLPYPINNVIEMKLSDLEFPTTYYPFSDEYENNYLWMKVEQGNGAESYLYIHIPQGNYYQAEFIKIIQSAIDELGLSLKIEYNLNFDNTGGVGVGDGTISIGIDGVNNITGINNIELNFSGRKLTSDIQDYDKSQKFFTEFEEQEKIINEYYYTDSNIDYKQRLGWMLGFRKDFYTGFTNYKSEGVMDILGSKYMFLIVDDFNNSTNINYISSSKESLLPDNIMARISIKGYAFSIQSQTDLSLFTEPRFYYGPVNITKLEIKIVDDFGRIVDLNNMDFSFTLSLTTIYSTE